MYTRNKTLAGEAGGIAPPFEENISGDMRSECLGSYITYTFTVILPAHIDCRSRIPVGIIYILQAMPYTGSRLAGISSPFTVPANLTVIFSKRRGISVGHVRKSKRWEARTSFC